MITLVVHENHLVWVECQPVWVEFTLIIIELLCGKNVNNFGQKPTLNQRGSSMTHTKVNVIFYLLHTEDDIFIGHKNLRQFHFNSTCVLLTRGFETIRHHTPCISDTQINVTLLRAFKYYIKSLIDLISNLLISVERIVLNSVPTELKNTVSHISNKYLVIKIYRDFSKYHSRVFPN